MKPWMWLVLFILTALGSVYLWKKPKIAMESQKVEGGAPEVIVSPGVSEKNNLVVPKSGGIPGPRSNESMSGGRIENQPMPQPEGMIPPTIPQEPPTGIYPNSGDNPPLGYPGNVPPPPPPAYPYPEAEPPPEYFEGDMTPQPFEPPPPLEEGEGTTPPNSNEGSI